MTKRLGIVISTLPPSLLAGRTLWADFVGIAEGANSAVEPGGGRWKLDPSEGSGSDDVILSREIAAFPVGVRVIVGPDFGSCRKRNTLVRQRQQGQQLKANDEKIRHWH